jgi:hypothetical protein
VQKGKKRKVTRKRNYKPGRALSPISWTGTTSGTADTDDTTFQRGQDDPSEISLAAQIRAAQEALADLDTFESFAITTQRLKQHMPLVDLLNTIRSMSEKETGKRHPSKEYQNRWTKYFKKLPQDIRDYYKLKKTRTACYRIATDIAKYPKENILTWSEEKLSDEKRKAWAHPRVAWAHYYTDEAEEDGKGGDPYGHYTGRPVKKPKPKKAKAGAPNPTQDQEQVKALAAQLAERDKADADRSADVIADMIRALSDKKYAEVFPVIADKGTEIARRNELFTAAECITLADAKSLMAKGFKRLT